MDHPEFLPDPSLSRSEMERLQQEIAASATFADDLEGALNSGVEQQPTVAGVDQGFDGDTATSAAVVMRGETVIERTHASKPAEIPYIPGLLSFREGGAVLSALGALETDPDVVLVDGSGRIHFREAGLATHVGVTLDQPTVGVAKSLLCGTPAGSTSGLSVGARVPVEADETVTTPEGTVIGHAVQTRQYDTDSRHINPVYTSPGHRVGAETAADIAERYATRYKLPEPIHRADRYAAELTD
jgi:deoxyribonuclease V